MINDETYEKYVNIVYEWGQIKTNTTVKIYRNRHEKYSELILDNISVNNVALFNWGSSGTSNWVTIYRTCLH